MVNLHKYVKLEQKTCRYLSSRTFHNSKYWAQLSASQKPMPFSMNFTCGLLQRTVLTFIRLHLACSSVVYIFVYEHVMDDFLFLTNVPFILIFNLVYPLKVYCSGFIILYMLFKSEQE